MANKTPGHPSSFTLFNLTTAYSISTRPSQDGTSRDGSPKKDVEVARRPNWVWWQDLESPEKVVFASPITYNLRKFVRKNFLKKILIEEFYSFLCLFICLLILEEVVFDQLIAPGRSIALQIRPLKTGHELPQQSNKDIRGQGNIFCIEVGIRSLWICYQSLLELSSRISCLKV